MNLVLVKAANRKIIGNPKERIVTNLQRIDITIIVFIKLSV